MLPRLLSLQLQLDVAQTKMQLGSKLIALLRRNNANAQSNLNACEASGIKSEMEREEEEWQRKGE